MSALVCVLLWARIVTLCLRCVRGSCQSGERIPLTNAALKASKGASYVNSGQLQVRQATITPRPSFLDYITGGCEINFLVRC